MAPELEFFPTSSSGSLLINLVGAANAHTALDASTASWVQMIAGAGVSQVDLGFADPTLPLDAMVYGVRVHVYYDTGNGTTNFSGQVISTGLIVQTSFTRTSNQSGTPIHLDGAYVTSSPTGLDWQESELAIMAVRLTDNHAGSTLPRIMSAALRILYYNKPSAAFVGPSGSTNNGSPVITWTFQGDGLPQGWYELKVFSAAQVAANGFDPNTSLSTWESSIVPSSAQQRQVGINLPDGVYFFYVRAAQNVAGRQHWSDWNLTSLVIDRPPNIPTLLAPAPGSKEDLSGGPTVQWNYTHPSPGSPQAAWALRRKFASLYEYWRVSDSTWQSSIQWNGGALGTFNFPPGSWPNGVVYNWSINTRDADLDESGFANDSTVEGDGPPVVTITSPSGTITDTTRPFVRWNFTDPEGDPQEQYQVKVFTVTSLFLGADPLSDDGVWNSGVIAGTETTKQIAVHLENLTSYLAYVRVFADGQWSAWTVGPLFDINLTPPLAPALTVTLDDPNGRVLLSLVGHNNLLTQNQADFEAGTIGWEDQSNSVLSQEIVQHFNGLAALRVTRGGIGGNMAVRTLAGSLGFRVNPGTLYTARARFRANTTGRSIQLAVNWYNAAGASIGTSNTVSGTDTNSAWTELAVEVTPPANTVFGALLAIILAPAASEVHFLDTALVAPGTLAQTAWNKGGWLQFAYTIEYSNDGLLWLPVRGAYNEPADVEQKLNVFDYEIIPRVLRRYRAFTVAQV